MTLQNLQVQLGPAGLVVTATWRHPRPQIQARAWLQQKIREWKGAR